MNLHDTAQERVSVRTWLYTYYNVLCSTPTSSFVGKVENCGTNSQELIATAIYIDSHTRSEEHTSELQSHSDLVCRLLLEKKNIKYTNYILA